MTEGGIVNRAFKFIVFLLCLCAGVPAAYAQNCSLQTMVGTYVLHEIGASHFLNPTPQPTLHFVGATAPFADVGLVTFKPNGIGNGYYWITNRRAGRRLRSHSGTNDHHRNERRLHR